MRVPRAERRAAAKAEARAARRTPPPPLEAPSPAPRPPLAALERVATFAAIRPPNRRGGGAPPAVGYTARLFTAYAETGTETFAGCEAAFLADLRRLVAVIERHTRAEDAA